MPTVKLFANLRKVAGTKELSAAGSTLGEVLSELREQSPPLVDAILDGGTLRPHVVITINGHNAVDLNTAVTEQDMIAIFPPIAGGTSPHPYPQPLYHKRRGESRRMNGWMV